LIGSCLLTKRVDYRALIPLRRAYLNTAGEPDADSVVVEHNAMLCATEPAARVYEQLALYIEKSPLDELQLSGATEQAVELMLRALPHWRADVEWRESPCVDLAALRGAGADHLSVISRNTREQLRRSLRKYGDFGELSVAAAETLAEAHMMFDELLLLHEARWQSLGQCGGFATSVRRDFHRLFLERAFPAGQVQLLRVRAGDRVLGVLYNLVAKGHVCFYQSGLRFDESNQLKPGLVAHHLAIQHCLQSGYDLYDFLPSSPGEGRYKSSLANASRRLGTVLLKRPGWRRQWFDLARAARTHWIAHQKP
jgi:CelD/BcsL family acetyltransferase involved in cellulose biosynthesis